MTVTAFDGRAEVRDAALARVAAHIDRKARIAGLFRWDGERGTIAASLVGSEQVEDWERGLGLSPWLAYALDTVTGSLANPGAVEVTENLLHAIVPGTDTAGMAHRLVIAFLDRMAAEEAIDPVLEEVRVKLRGAQERGLAGEELPGAEWRQLRRAAMAASQAVPAQDAIGAVFEAAAWDARRSPTTAAEVLRHWMHLRTLRARQQSDWTSADDARAQELLSEMSRRFIEHNPEEKRDVYQLLEEHHPEFEARLRANAMFRGDCAIVSARAAAETLVAVAGAQA